MFGVLQEFGRSKAGNPKLKIDGRWYPAGRNNLDGLVEGGRVEYEEGSFPGSDGKPVACINKIRPAPVANGPGPVSGAVGAIVSRQSAVIPVSAPVDEASLRFISNVVGSAIAAKTLDSPTDIRAWTLAAREALQALSEPPKAAAPVDPEFNDDMPEAFYKELPPGATQPKGGNTPW